VRQKDQESIADPYFLLEVQSEGNRGGAQEYKGLVDTGDSFLFMPERVVYQFDFVRCSCYRLLHKHS